jgi:hypothetical protein
MPDRPLFGYCLFTSAQRDSCFLTGIIAFLDIAACYSATSVFPSSRADRRRGLLERIFPASMALP